MAVGVGPIEGVGDVCKGIELCPESIWFILVPRIGGRVDRDGGVRVSSGIACGEGAREEGDRSQSAGQARSKDVGVEEAHGTAWYYISCRTVVHIA